MLLSVWAKLMGWGGGNGQKSSTRHCLSSTRVLLISCNTGGVIEVLQAKEVLCMGWGEQSQPSLRKHLLFALLKQLFPLGCARCILEMHNRL